MYNVSVMLIKPLGDHMYSVDGGIVGVSSCSHASHKYRQSSLCSIFIHDPKHAGMLFAKLTHGPHRCGRYCLMSLIYPIVESIYQGGEEGLLQKIEV